MNFISSTIVLFMSLCSQTSLRAHFPIETGPYTAYIHRNSWRGEGLCIRQQVGTRSSRGQHPLVQGLGVSLQEIVWNLTVRGLWKNKGKHSKEIFWTIISSLDCLTFWTFRKFFRTPENRIVTRLLKFKKYPCIVHSNWKWNHSAALWRTERLMCGR